MINIFPIFKVGQHIKALASRKATYSQFKFDTMIFIVLGVGANNITSLCFHIDLKVPFFPIGGKMMIFFPIELVWVPFPKR